MKAEKKRKADDLQKQIEDKMNSCFKASDSSKCVSELNQLQKQQTDMRMGKAERQWDLAWRLFVEGPRGRKDYYADKQGNLIDNPY
jgi:hypothetical protein